MFDEGHSNIRLARSTGLRAAEHVDAIAPLKLLVLGALPFGELDEARICCVANPLEPFDVAYVPGSVSGAAFAEFVKTAENPAAPVISHGGALGARADAVLEHGGPGDLTHACVQLAPLAERVRGLPSIPRGAERAALLALALAVSRQQPIEASWQPGSRGVIGYEMLSGVDEPRALLEQLADIGLFKRRDHERLHTCGHCGGCRVFAREVCSRCSSSDLAEHELLHHYTCGLQAPEPVFKRGEGYECPKCRKPFRHYGVDYDKPGQVISCSSCDATISEPDVFFVCADCGGETDSEQAQVVRFFHYQLTAQGVSAAEAGVLPMLGRTGEAHVGNSLQEFRVMVQNYVHIAERVERPLTLVRFDVQAGRGMPLERGLVQLFTLVQETARKGDAVAMADGCVLACLPETDVTQVQPLLERVDRLVAAQLAEGFAVHPHVVPRERVLSLLRALH